MMTKKPFTLGDTGGLTADPAMEKVIAAQASANALRREVAALRKDRDDLLKEYTDLQNARQVTVIKSAKASSHSDTIRVSFGDMHGMRQDPAALAALVRDIKVLDPDELVFGGDMLECGGWLAKHQPIGFVALLDYTYQEDLAATNSAFDSILEAAGNVREVHYLEGQHEDRVERWIVDQVTANARDAEFLRRLCSPEFLLGLETRGIKYYRRSEIYGDGLPRGWVRLGHMLYTHELGASRNAASEAVGRTAANVTFFHTHRADMSTRVFPSVGLCAAYNPGCLCIMQPVWKNSDVTNWSQGYQIEFISKTGAFQVVHVPIWRGESLAGAMVERFKKQ